MVVETNGPLVVSFSAPAEAFAGEEQTFVLGIGEGPSADKIEARMPRGRDTDSNASEAASADWLASSLADFTFEGVPRRLRAHYANAAYQILSNTKSPRGQLGRLSCFPSRGTYCAHYLWDACFTDIGVAQFNERLAEDFLVALCEVQEPDGKIPQFACATWNRPDESQPPLIAWSAWRLYERFGNKELIRDVYEPLCRFVEWWFANRDEDRDGLVEYQHALESGWDDSPRFDEGRIAGVDLNAYLNREMRLLAKMAPVLARDDEAAEWQARADAHDHLIYSRLFDREDGLFYDRLVWKNRLHKVLTPASFMPLWTGITVPHEVAHTMIARYLINPKHFFGSKPFPVVAYSDRNYKPDAWWRGPVWPNIAWAMTEILRIHGFHKEHREAVRKLAGLMAAHDEVNELYNSATGSPLGSPGLCWSDAVFMDLAREMGRV
jgi:glycogen debranching enzyme